MSYGPPSGPPPSNQQYYGAPPPNQGYGQPPFMNPGYPPQHGGQYQQPPPQGGYPPQPQGYQPPGHAPGYSPQGFPPQGPPPPHGYPGQFPPQQVYGPPPLPSPGYDPRAAAPGDGSREADALRGAMKGFGTNESVLIQVLSKLDPLRMALVRNTYTQRHNRSLEHDLTKETSGYFREGLVAIARGPLLQDVHNIQKAIKGLGTKEAILDDVLLGRQNADMRAIKQAYQQAFHRTMEADVKGDLSMKIERLFGLVMSANRAEENALIIPQEIDRDCSELHRAMEGRVGTDEITVCSILALRSDGQLRVIAQQFQQKYQRTLEKSIESEFSGHMKDALLLIVGRATDRAMTDAVQLEATMKGPGTKDDLLMNRAVRVHWDRAHMDQVKRAYQFRFKKDLLVRIRGDTSGDQEKLLLAIFS